MADKNKVLIEFQIVQKGKNISVLQKETEKLSKSQDKAANSQKKLSKQQEMGYGRQKQGLVQTANGTKNFSKLAQTINGGGQTSLVGAYATLAANVFAATAAFNALSRAAQFQQLQQGLEIIGNQSGRTLSVLAEGLREATGNALSLEQASSAAALGVSGGFGARELEGLAVIAKGASVALGRDMADAFDRLTRGAIKLEPEILDELGIMVRLDDAVEKYAAQLGKGASALSQLERRQAFVNEILEQGEAKFGDIAEQADPTPYQRLGASFADLTKDFFTFVNETLKLNSAVEFLADNLLALVGVVIGFGSTIATQMIPALGNQAASARAAASAASELAESALEAADAELEAAKSSFLAFKGTAGNFKEAQKQVAASGGSVKAYDKALASLRRSENMRTINLKKQSGEAKVAAEMQIRSIQQQILVTEQLKLAEQNRAAAQVSANLAILESNTATVTANVIEDYTTGQIGLGAAFAANAKNITDHFNKLDELQPVTGNLDKLNRKLTKGFQLLGVQLKTLSAAFLKFLPLIGVALVVAGAVGLAINKIFFTPEIKAYNKQVETLNTILESVADKAEEYQKAINGTLSPAIAQQREYNILANTIKEINENLKETIKLQEEAALSGNSRRVGFGLDLGEGSGIAQTIRGGAQNMGQGVVIQIEAIEKSAESFANNFGKIFDGIPEIVRATFGEVNQLSDETLIEGVTNLAKIKDTPQYQSLLETLKLEPYRKFLLNPDNGLDFSVLTQDLSDDELIKFLKDVSTAIDTADKKFGGINDAVNTFSATLKEAEKTGSQFLQKFFPKTAVGDLLDNLVSLDKALNEIAESSDGVKQKQQAMGQALSETGPMIRKFFGKEVSDNLTTLRVLEGELKKLEESGEEFTKVFLGYDFDGMVPVPQFTTKGDQKRAEIAQQVNVLGKDGATITKEAVELARALQNEEILRKATLEGISNIQGVISKVSKESAMGTRINLELEKQRRKIAQDQMDTQLLMQGRAVGAAQEEIKTEEDRLILISQLEEKLENAKDLGLKDSEIAGIKLSLQQQQNLVFQEQLATATETFKIEQSRLQVELTRLSSTEKIAQAEAKIAELQAKSAAIRSGRSSEGIIEQIRRQEETEKKTLENARTRLKLEKAMNAIKASILKAELDVIMAKAAAEGDYKTLVQAFLSKKDIDTNLTFLNNALDKTFEATEEGMGKALENAFAGAFASDKFGIISGTDNTLLALLQGSDIDPEDKLGKFTTSLQIVQSTMAAFAKNLEEIFGADGKLVASVANLGSTLAGVTTNILASFKTIDEALNNPESGIGNKEAMAMKFAAVGQAVSSVLGSLQQMTQADSQRRVEAVEKAIALEKKLDGKSAESVAKINAMEKKKEAIQRKAFETNKKMQMAQAIVSSASAAAQTYAALAFNPPLAISMAAIIGALGLAQVAIIRKTKFEGGSSTEAPKNTSLEIGKRSSAVDTAKSATGGELNYLRGGRTDGTNLGGAGASFPGAAMGRKGYADGGVIVGERGPELITPAAPVDVTPNYALGGQPTNVNFTINAVDAAGVEDVLMNQRGNLIRMIREAANENGERFLETVDTQSYGGSK